MRLELSRSLWSVRRRFPHTLTIGRYRIRLPLGSWLPESVLRYPLANVAIGRIADALHSKYPGVHAIDIGANSGDTTAMIRRSFDIPVLCVEGDDKILALLRDNVSSMGSDITIEPSFIGEEGLSVNLKKINAYGLNASIVNALGTEGGIKLRSLQSILGSHPQFSGAKLLKIDAEGYDFDIILHSIEFIASVRPVVFFEYNPFEYNRGINPEEATYGPKVMEKLAGAGYTDFLYYDNFGHFLMRVASADRSAFRHLHNYLESNWTNGMAVPYFDICAFHCDDSALVEHLI